MIEKLFCFSFRFLFHITFKVNVLISGLSQNRYQIAKTVYLNCHPIYFSSLLISLNILIDKTHIQILLSVLFRRITSLNMVSSSINIVVGLVFTLNISEKSNSTCLQMLLCCRYSEGSKYTKKLQRSQITH